MRDCRSIARRQLAVALALGCLTWVLLPAAYSQERTSATDQRLAKWLERFPEADANGDGVLSVPEATAFRQKRASSRPQRPADARSPVRPALAPTHADVSYGPHPRHVLDVFLAESADPTPVLIFFHGGGFVAGDKQKGATQPLSHQCVTAGISVVSANYRYVRPGRDGAPGAPFPAPMLDGARVVQFVRAKAADWNIDPKRVALSGGSAGACMSIWIASHDDMVEPDSADPVARQSTRVSAVVSYAGPTTLDPAVILEHVGGRRDIHPSLLPFFAVTSIDDLATPEKRKLVEEASALNLLSSDDPPMYLKHGGVLDNVPLPDDASYGLSIHHPMFGKLLKDRYDELEIECYLACTGQQPDIDEITFLKRVFQMGQQ